MSTRKKGAEAINVKLDKVTKDRLQEICLARDETASQVLRRAINKYIDDNKALVTSK